MALVGRRPEFDEVRRLLDRTADGSGGVLVLTGPPGSGKTTLAAAAADRARNGGFNVVCAAAMAATPGRLVWAQVLVDAGAPAAEAAALLAEPGTLELDAAMRQLAAGTRRLIVLDDIDRGGPRAVELLRLLAGRLLAGSTAVLATATTPLGVGTELRLGGLTENELSEVIGPVVDEVRHAVWIASRGMPGSARSLAAQLSGREADYDPLVHLALHARSTVHFLAVDTTLVRTIEAALERASGGAVQARLLARLARELLGDTSAAPRRRHLVDQALELARRSGDRQAVAEVLDARLHALWDPAGADDRLAAAVEITDLAHAARDEAQERQGLFWRFIALVELGRVDEAEAALSTFERLATAAGDDHGMVITTSRHAMLAILRGRFDTAARLVEEVRSAGARVGLADSDNLVGTLRGAIDMVREHDLEGTPIVEHLYGAARRLPGHLFEAAAARCLALTGHQAEAASELDRILPRAVIGSGPTTASALAHLAAVAVATGDRDACARLHQALAPYRGRLLIQGGAVAVTGPASHYLGLLDLTLGHADAAIRYFNDAIGLETRIGALPWLAHSLNGLADALTLRAADDDLVAASTARREAGIHAERLGVTGLLRRLTPPADEWMLRRDGPDWVLVAGQEQARLRDCRGLHHLRALLAAPRRDIPALDITAGGAGLAPSATTPLLDRAAVAAYRDRLGQLDTALDAADRDANPERSASAARERDALLAELHRARGLAGRTRRTSAEQERARVNVTRTLRSTLTAIGTTAPLAAGHLQASVHTGLYCRYEPAAGGPAGWRL